MFFIYRVSITGARETGMAKYWYIFDFISIKIKPPVDPEGGEEEEEEASTDDNNAEVADFWNESTFFEAVGVGVGQTESYYIVLAIKQLSSKPGISKVRFFGKFYGTQGYVYY